MAGGGAAPEIEAASAGNASPAVLQRSVEMRDVGRGEESGFARLPELIDRLNAMSQGLTFRFAGHMC